MFIESQQAQQKKKMGRPRKYDEAFRQTALVGDILTGFSLVDQFPRVGYLLRPELHALALHLLHSGAGPVTNKLKGTALGVTRL